ncbi:MAG: XisI protein [Nostoc sp. LPT]|uniref:element excision factor XisI family protein n=1 Tax=uncultured Nostoc sp. TaxID=340711 RepID=UPI001DDD3538|nr:XisI protein [Nostoc sp. LPT]
MDYTKLDDYRHVIETILSEYASLPYSYANIQSKVVFDRTRVGAAFLKETRYLWMDIGWDGECLRHATRTPHSRLSGSY